jgi:hypothetical protein
MVALKMWRMGAELRVIWWAYLRQLRIRRTNASWSLAP